MPVPELAVAQVIADALPLQPPWVVDVRPLLASAILDALREAGWTLVHDTPAG